MGIMRGNTFHGGEQLKRRDFWVILAVVLAGLALFAVSRLAKPGVALPGRKTLTLSAEAGGKTGVLPAADSYLRIKQGEDYYDLIPLLGPDEIVITQAGGWENVIHIDKDSVKMHSANCPNQDCIRQGEMTLSNISVRVFQNWITCLPHQVSLELLTRDEALAIRGKMP
jgi:hypothetical protein